MRGGQKTQLHVFSCWFALRRVRKKMKITLWKFFISILIGQAPLWALAQTASPGAANGKTILRISGLISTGGSAGVVTLDGATLDALPVHSFTTTAPWFKNRTSFSGPLLSDVLDSVGAKGTQLAMRALNDYKVMVPVSDAYQYQPILARRINNQLISVRDKGPLFLIYPFDSRPELNTEVFFARSIWQIKSIQVE